MHYVANQVLRNDGLAEDAVHNAFEGVARNFHALYGRSAEDRKNYLLKALELTLLIGLLDGTVNQTLKHMFIA